MTSGGHARSGPAPDPNSARSDRRGLAFVTLPSEGYGGEAPPFPLPKRLIWNEWFEGSGRDRERRRELEEASTEATWEREVELWVWAWTTPQACAWALEPWRWYSVAMWVRTFVICEGSEATAADKNALHRFADQVGLSPAGLKENGWAIARDETAPKREERGNEPAKSSSRDRMKVVKGSGA